MQFAKGIRSDRFGMFFLLLLLASCAAASSKNYSEILTSANRPDAEKALDAVRKPQEVMAFYEVKTGQRVADIFASRGYYTAIYSTMAVSSRRARTVSSTQRIPRRVRNCMIG